MQYKAFYSTSTVFNWSFILWNTVANKTTRKVSTGGFASNDRCRWTKWLIEVRYPHLKMFKDHLQSYFTCRIRNFQRYLVNIQSTSTVEIQRGCCLKFVQLELWCQYYTYDIKVYVLTGFKILCGLVCTNNIVLII